VDDARREQVIDQWVARLRQWGIAPIAPALLPALQPLGLIASQAILFSQPLLTLFAQDRSVQELAWLLDDANALDVIERCLTSVNDRAS